TFRQAVDLATDCVRAFGAVSAQLGDATQHVSTVVGNLAESTAGLVEAAREVRLATERYDTVTRSLASTNQTLFDMNATMREAVQRLESVSARLSDSIEAAKTAMHGIVDESLEAIQTGLGRSVSELVTALDAAGTRTVEAYEETANRVIEVVDEGMSDLTDRLSAELSTLAARLPAEVASLNQAMATIRTHIRRATREMESAANQLATQTQQSLTARLQEYDQALADAMDHFSGTLERWDGRVSDIASAATELRRAAEMATRLLPPKQGSAE